MAGAATKRAKVVARADIQERITAEAQKFAKTKGLYRSMLKAKSIVYEMNPAIAGLRVDVKRDPETGDSGICFHITTRQTVDAAVRSYYALREELRMRIPVKHRLSLSFLYEFD